MSIMINISVACGFFIVGLVFGCTIGFLVGSGIGFMYGLWERAKTKKIKHIDECPISKGKRAVCTCRTR